VDSAINNIQDGCTQHKQRARTKFYNYISVPTAFKIGTKSHRSKHFIVFISVMPPNEMLYNVITANIANTTHTAQKSKTLRVRIQQNTDIYIHKVLACMYVYTLAYRHQLTLNSTQDSFYNSSVVRGRVSEQRFNVPLDTL